VSILRTDPFLKTKLVLLLSLGALASGAQTNFDVLVCKNASYTNATIVGATPAYLLVSHDHGVAKVTLTNLPDSLQQHYHYDPDKAAAAAAAEKVRQVENAKANAARARHLASLRGTNQVIRVVAVLDAFGQCQTSVGRVYMIGLPGSVGDYLNRYNLLKSSVVSLTEKVDKLNRLLMQMEHPDSTMSDKDLAQDDLSKMKANMSEMELGLVQNTSIVAYSTRTQYSGFPMWQCVNQ
jgi:hypothetical protein